MSVQIAQLVAKVGLDASDLERGVIHVRTALGGLATSFTSLTTHAAAATRFLVGDVVIASWDRLNGAIADNAREMIAANRGWEQYQTQFAVQLRNTELAAERLRDLEQFAVRTPFDLDEIIEADIILQNFGLHSEGAARAFGKSGEEIRRIAGDVAAGTKATFSEISMWLGRFAAGDTGQAIMRMQELGVVTRQELREMGVEFDKSGSLVSPLDEAMTAMLALMERKFGGLMDIQSRTLGGMESNAQDWMDRQKRLWGEPVFEVYKDGLGDLLGFLDSEGVQRAMDIGREMWASLVGWIGDVARDWAGELAGLAADALYWGANVVDQFAAGIAGSGAVSGALRSMADEVAAWLRPGSPPRIMPWLTEYGLGAARSYWEGWALADPEITGWLHDAFASLEPHLRAIEEAGGLTDADLAGFRGAFGEEAGRFEGYVQAYGGLVVAARVAAEAQLAYDAALAEGDAEALAAAEAQLELAREQEQAAQARVAAEQARIAQSMSAEARLARAVEERAAQEERVARLAADREAEAEARRQEAEQRRIAEARLRWELAVAETPEKQLAIWRRELAATEMGTAEYYDTLTRIVQLEQRIRDERARGAAGAAGGWSAGAEVAEAVEDAVGNPLEGFAIGAERGGIDWAGIGASIGQVLLEKVTEKLAEWPARLLAWAQTGEASTALFQAGAFLADVVLSGLRGIFGGDAAVGSTQASMETHLKQAAYNTGAVAAEVGGKLAEGVIARFAAVLTAGGTAEETMAAWEATIQDWRAPIAGVATRLFGDPVDAAIVAQALMDVANDETVAAGVRAAAEAQAQRYIDAYGLKVDAEFGVVTAERFNELARERGILGAAEEAGDAWGTEMGDAAAEAFQRELREGLVYGPEPPPGYYDPPPSRRGGPEEGYLQPQAYSSGTGPYPGMPDRGGDTIQIHFNGPVSDAKQARQGVVQGLRAAGVAI